MKVPQMRYKVPDYYGDLDFHIVNRQCPLSIENPCKFKITGETFEIPSHWGTVTALKSNWLWRYSFASLSNSSTSSITNEWGNSETQYYFYYYRYYGESIGSNPSTVVSLNVGIDYSDRYYYVNYDLNSVITAAYQMNSSLARSSISGSRIRFADTSSWYIMSRPGYPSDTSKRAVVVKFKKDYEAYLPSDMYTIENNIITWNTTHPIYTLLNGFEAIAARS